jgi:hypothetical protein
MSGPGYSCCIRDVRVVAASRKDIGGNSGYARKEKSLVFVGSGA